MAWIQIRLYTHSEQAEPLSDLLTELGAVSVTFEDSLDTPVYEPLPGETPLWNNTTVIGLFDALTDMDHIVEQLKANDCLEKNFPYKIEALEDKDWERAWMDDFHPMQFGKRLWICPSWREAPEPNAANVMLDPGLAFGTGTHPTTALCLRWLDARDLQGKTVIDFGCGSGILSIAALKLGAKKVIGIDIDPQAIEASRNNAQRNHVEQSLELYLPKDLPNNLQADVVVANILAGPLKELAPQIASLVIPQGELALSGLLREQALDLQHHYSTWFEMDEPAYEEDWSRLNGIKK